MEKIKPKPVTIITGFLGAGKTTWMNALLAHDKEKKYAIIENEFGQEGIDGELVIGADESIFELSNGCLCCSLNEDLIDLLNRLWNREDQFDELLVETTGIADPAAAAVPFLADPVISKYYKLQRVVCLVDARFIEKELAATEEARKQIAFSDVLLINKTDIVTPEQLERVRSLLLHINPFAVVMEGNRHGYPVKEIMQLKRDRHIEPHHHTHHHEHHHHDLSSLSFSFPAPFNIELLAHRLMVFLSIQSQDIYRVKGIIHAHDRPEKIILQSVSELLAVTPGKKWKQDEERASRIVFIGRRLQAKGFEKMLEQCLHT